jgi:uncharacterized protein YggE
MFVIALTLSACVTAPQPRTLAVSGTGTVYLTPDIAYLTIGVHNENQEVASAVETNNIQAQSLVDALKNAGIAGEDIQTSNFSVYTTTQYDKIINVPNGTTYAVDNTVTVTVRDLSQLASLLGTTIAAGANNINGINFDVADKTAAMTQARQKAMANASSLAGELAQTAGVSLGSIQEITYSEYFYSPSSYGMGGGGASVPSSSVPIQAGETQISVTVSVTYTIK